MNSFGLSVRRIVSKPGESILAVLGIALASSILAAVISLFGAYNASFEHFATMPQARQISIHPAMDMRGEGEAAVRVDTTAERPPMMNLQDANAALEEFDGLQAVYTARYMNFTSSELASFPQGSGVFTGRAPGSENGGTPGAVPIEKAAAESSQEVDTPLLTDLQGYMVTPSYFEAFGLELAQGALFDEKDVSEGSALAAVGSALADKLFADGQVLDKRIRLNGTIYRITAVLAPYAYETQGLAASPDDLLYVPVQTAFRAFPGGGGMPYGLTNELLFSVEEGADTSDLARNLEVYFQRLYGEDSIAAQTELARIRMELEKRLQILNLLNILAVCIAVAALINIFNLMNGRVSRRSALIAVQRALGSGKRAVFSQTLLESALLAGSGTVLGIVAAPFVSIYLYGILESGFSGGVLLGIRWDLILLLGLAALGAAIFSALPAAWNASRFHIVDALRDE